MHFTQEDYIKIENWLHRNSVKDTEFQEALPFTGKEIVTVVQDGHNRKVNIQEFINQLYKHGVEDFLNVTNTYRANNITLKEAIRLIPAEARKEGQVITFLNTDGNWEIYQFIGKLNQWNNPTLWNNPFDWEKLIVDSILPDEEDLTKSAPDANGNAYLSLKDRKYEPDKYSGLGRKILRRRVVEIEDPVYGIQEKNLLLQADFEEENTVYEIRYDFDLNGQEITIPEGGVLDFQGGSLSNGKIFGGLINTNKYKIFNNIYYANIVNNQIFVDWFVSSNLSDIVNYIIKNNQGKEIIFGKNTYYIDNPLNIVTNTKLRGINTVDTIIISDKDAFHFEKNCRNCKISNLRIKSNTLNKNIGFLFDYENGGAELYIDNILIINYNIGFDVGEIWWNNVITNCRINNAVIGLNMHGVKGQCLVNKLEHCYFNECVTGAIFAGCKAFFVDNCNFGGILNEYCTAAKIITNSYILFNSCNFETYKPLENQGAVHVASSSLCKIDNSTFLSIENNNNVGGAILSTDKAKVSVKNTFFYTDITNLVAISDSQLTFENCNNVTTKIYGQGRLYNLDLLSRYTYNESCNVGLSSNSTKKTILLAKCSDETINITGSIIKKGASSFSNSSCCITFGIFKGNKAAPQVQYYFENKLYEYQAKFGICNYNNEEYYCIKTYDDNIYSGGDIIIKLDYGEIIEIVNNLDNFIELNNKIGDKRPNCSHSIEPIMFYDEKISKIIWNIKGTWITSNGDNADAKTIGTFASKPNTPSTGFSYFCTDRQTVEGGTNGIMIYHKGNDVWVDALGRVIS